MRLIWAQGTEKRAARVASDDPLSKFALDYLAVPQLSGQVFSVPAFMAASAASSLAWVSGAQAAKGSGHAERAEPAVLAEARGKRPGRGKAIGGEKAELPVVEGRIPVARAVARPDGRRRDARRNQGSERRRMEITTAAGRGVGSRGHIPPRGRPDLGVDARSARGGRFQILQDEKGRPFAEHHAVVVRLVGPAAFRAAAARGRRRCRPSSGHQRR